MNCFQIWHLSNSKEIESNLPNPANPELVNPNLALRRMSDESNIFSYLESQRAYLENRVGVERLIRVYKLVSRFNFCLLIPIEDLSRFVFGVYKGAYTNLNHTFYR